MKFAYIANENQSMDVEALSLTNLPIVGNSEGFDAWIKYEENVPVLETNGGHKYRAEWSGAVIKNRLKTIGKKQPLFKAINIEKSKWVLDATFGFGVDSLCLLKLGMSVIAFERNPLLFMMGQIQRRINVSSDSFSFLNKLDLRYGSAMDSLAEQFWPEGCVLYYDPMYPEKKKSALPKGEIQLLSEICSSEDQFNELYDRFTQSQMRKLVVKRPHYIEPELNGVSHSVASKLVRYDVYLNPKS